MGRVSNEIDGGLERMVGLAVGGAWALCQPSHNLQLPFSVCG